MIIPDIFGVKNKFSTTTTTTNNNNGELLRMLVDTYSLAIITRMCASVLTTSLMLLGFPNKVFFNEMDALPTHPAGFEFKYVLLGE